MIPRLSVGLFYQPDGALLLDLTPRLRSASFKTGEHGFKSFTAELDLLRAESFWLMNVPGLPHVRVEWQGTVVWEGRLEDRALIAGGVRLTAIGYWRALYDVPYTALWSSTEIRDWYKADERNVAGLAPKLYTMDNDNRLFIGLTKNTVYRNNTDHGCWALIIPHNSGRNFARWTGSYEMLAPANFVLQLVRTNAASGEPYSTMAGGAVLQSVFATGALQSGSFTLAPTQNTLLFWLVNATGANYTMAGESGTFYAKLTNVRAQSTTSTAVYADEIVAALVAYVNGINSLQLLNSTALISSPALDLLNEVYQDQYPGDIIEYLCGLGDSNTPPQLYEAAVWENRVLQFRQRAGAHRRTWWVDVAEADLEQTIETLHNSAYAVYKDVGDFPLRSANEDVNTSIARHSITRRQALQLRTTSLTAAQATRSVYVNDRQTIRPRTTLRFNEVFDAAGNRWPLFAVRAWDRLVLRNVPPESSVEPDRLRSFILRETDYDIKANIMRAVPEEYQPQLGLAQQRVTAGSFALNGDVLRRR